MISVNSAPIHLHTFAGTKRELIGRKIGMGWTVADLDKPQILVESTFGDSHPGSAHLDQFVGEAVKGITEAGGKAACYFVTYICDGIAQGHDSINYSLVSRDMIANMIEIHGNSTGFDGGVFIASCDKSVPACLMGTASTMQIMTEALGLMLPGSALMPATSIELKEMAYKAGAQVMQLALKGLRVSDIVTKQSFENAIMVHAAISGSIQAVLKARPFDCEEDAIAAVLLHQIHPGNAVIIRYEGPIALIEEGDLIRIDIPSRILEVVGINGIEMPQEEVNKVLAQRKTAWKPKESKYKRGVLKLFSEKAVSPMKGGYMND
ncbi:MAG: dihydroxy-acid dehydratase [Bacteroidaceae bacterium]|nr:dihydroxy-acid dehydratase [Bacteroidaceae bacterium]